MDAAFYLHVLNFPVVCEGKSPLLFLHSNEFSVSLLCEMRIGYFVFRKFVSRKFRKEKDFGNLDWQ